MSVGRARWSGACATIVKKVQAELAELPSTCKADGDCTCYAGGVEGVSGCGGVSDLAAAKRLQDLAREFQTARCDYGVDCAPRLCRAACMDGRCGSRR